MSFEINETKVSEWINKWKDSFGSIADDPTSVKTLIYLTLLERGEEMSSYQDIADELKRRGVVEGEVDDFVPLRNGMNQIVNALKTHSLYQIENRKNGKVSSYRLRSRSQSAAKNNGASGTRTGKIRTEKIVKLLEDPVLTDATEFEYVVKKLVIDRVMPFYGIYLPMTAASRWVLYSEGEAKDRSKYEADKGLWLLDDWLAGYKGKEISIIGLGIGEGIGEIEIIERLLDKKKQDGGKTFDFSRIHYCAVDTNVHLLMDHVERLKHKFKEELDSNRLLCGVACGNFLTDFPRIVERLRDEFATTGQLEPGQVFLPDTGTLVSILGNVVGNAEKAKEWSYFEPLRAELNGYDLAFLIGVSVRQPDSGKPETYEELEDLLLATPRYLTHELSMLQTRQGDKDPEKKEKPEFVLPTDKEEKDKRWPGVRRAKYEGAGTTAIKGAQVTGEIYEFYYITKWDLTANLDGKAETIKEGSPLLLHNIIKFDKDTLIKFLESKGLYPSRHKSDPDDITSGNQNRRYVMIAMTSKPPV